MLTKRQARNQNSPTEIKKREREEKEGVRRTEREEERDKMRQE